MVIPAVYLPLQHTWRGYNPQTWRGIEYATGAVLDVSSFRILGFCFILYYNFDIFYLSGDNFDNNNNNQQLSAVFDAPLLHGRGAA